MNKIVENAKLVIICLVFILIISLIGLMFYQNLNKDTTTTITATVTYKGSDYIVVTDTTNKKYKLKLSDDIEENDVLSITIDHIDNTTDPATANVKEIDKISKTITFTIEDPKKEENTSNESTLNEGSNSNKTTSSTEEDVISYLNTVNKNLDNYQNDKTLSSSIKDGFVKIVDFLFYDGTICNKTFNELSDSAKLKVLSIVFSIDSKIEESFPNYKEEISTTSSKVYTNVKTKALEIYLDTTVKLCTNNDELCISAKKGLSDLKTSFSLTWDTIKSIAKENVSKLKDWYEVWRENE